MIGALHTLGDLLGAQVPHSLRGQPVTDIALDARELEVGGMFLACAGATSHGLDYLDQAREAGASVIAWEPAEGYSAPDDGEVKCFPVPGLRTQLGQLADRFFGQPSSQMTVSGVTGTNGKTSCAWLLASALQRLGLGGAMIGTIGWGLPGSLHAAELTTPDVITVHRRLARLVEAGARHVVMEVSSHALDQGRVDGVHFANALFTNLSRDHLDYHGDMPSYAEAKARLFKRPGLRTAVVNVDDKFGMQLFGNLDQGMHCVAVSTREHPELRATRWLRAADIQVRESGLVLTLRSSWGDASLESPLLGEFNAANLLLVLAVLLEQGIELPEAVQALGEVPAPTGRMQALPRGPNAPLVIVDFAHTPDALEKALLSARAHCRGRLWCVFGAGGDRDKGKRPLMGEVAVRLADRLVITSDNPRSEAPELIIADIRAGIGQQERVLEQADRA
ncbi:MAG: UDP-N-acetylmuramoyl-L-alanyl-D-glutamate--2,6-diaminopimelate ligase, partial [Gammaproteobacteria bacterium]|nr:UDP-N-acetylmuramoyl-L-alanyl-D-glutamate--2,6-diaminopimelate ligase [Gammaproteobacteria bacterium]